MNDMERGDRLLEKPFEDWTIQDRLFALCHVRGIRDIEDICEGKN